MNRIRVYLKQQKNYLKIVFLLLGIGFIISLFFYHKTTTPIFNTELKNITNILSNNHINYFLMHLLLIAILILATFTFIGLIFIPLYLLYEGICLGYNLASFTAIFHLKGFIFSLIYLLLTKIIYLIIIIILFKKIIILAKYLLNKLINKNSLNYNINNLKTIALALISIFINDLLIYLFAHKILYYISHILL